MKGLVKGILAIGTAIAVGCVIYKKIKKDKQNKEEFNIEETQELTEEQQEIYNEVRTQVMKEMKPIARINYIKRFIMIFSITTFYIFINHNVAVKYNLKREDVA